MGILLLLFFFLLWTLFWMWSEVRIYRYHRRRNTLDLKYYWEWAARLSQWLEKHGI